MSPSQLTGACALEQQASEKQVAEPTKGVMRLETGTSERGGQTRPASASAESNVCAICLSDIPYSETAQPECCDHSYCCCCILHWSTYKDDLWCPQCKLPFSSLITFRTLDGQLHDYPCKESVCLLKRSQWFSEYVKAREDVLAATRPTVAQPLVGSIIDEGDYLDYGRYYDEYDESEEIENYYFSAAAGRARIIIGNRRHGPNGYLSSGRMQARPAAPPQSKARNGKCSAEGEHSGTPSGKASGQQSSSKSAEPRQKQSQKSGSSSQKTQVRGKNVVSENLDNESTPGSSAGKKNAGRRARRNQMRAAADAKVGF